VSFTARGVALSLLLLTPLAVPVAFGVVSLGMVLSVPLAAHASVLGAQPDDTKFDDAIDAAEQAWKRKDWAKSKAEFLKAEKESGSLFHDYRMHLAFVYAELGEKTLGLEQLEKFADREQEKGNLKWAESERQNPDGTDDAPKILKYAELKPRLDAMKNGEKTPPPKAASPPTPPLVAPTPAPAPQPNLEEIARRAGEIAAAAASKSTEIRMRLESAQRLGQRRETALDAQQELDAVLALDPQNAQAARLKEEIKERWRPRRGDVKPVELKPNINIEMVYLEPGWFWMGSAQSPEEVVAAYPNSDPKVNDDYAKLIADEHPRHKVRLTKGFWLGKTEVTVNQFAAFVQESGHQTTAERPSEKFPLGSSFVWVGRDGKGWEEQGGINWRNPGLAQGDNHPVVHVSWDDANAFCKWLTDKHRREGKIASVQRYRLPSEAEWEYACRAGTSTAFSFGDQLKQGEGYLNAAGQGEGWSNEAKASEIWPFNDGWAKRTAPVGSFRPNAFGLYDMHGNVWEWCWDWYDAEWYKGGDRKDPIGPQTGSLRVLRGGSWGVYPRYLRSAIRNWDGPTYRNNFIGFRLCLDSE